jgi:dolichyl-phosphate-mannose-protein mannosyltransferase
VMSAPSARRSDPPLLGMPVEAEPTGPARGRWDWAGIALCVVATLGLGFRLIHLVGGRPLWIDEARLAINVASRSYLGLLRPLDYDQAAPPLFLWLEKAVTGVAGVSAGGLRILPFAAGLFLLAAAYPVARRFVGKSGAVAAFGGVALSPFVIYYSSEVKPYIVDAAVAIALIWLAVECGEGRRRRAFMGLLAAGVVGVWISTTVPFVLAAVGMGLLLCPNISRPERLRFIGTAGLLWFGSFAAAYLAVYGPASSNPYLHHFWAHSFFDPGPELWSRLWQATRDVVWGTFVGAYTEPPQSRWNDLTIDVGTAGLLLLLLLGARHVFRVHGVWRAVLLCGPMLVACSGAVLHLYPVALRVMLFTVPLLIILAAAGLEHIIGRIRQPLRARAWLVSTMVILVVPGLRDMGAAAELMRWIGHREAFREFVESATEAEPVYVGAGSVPSWLFKTTDWSRPDTVVLRRLADLAGSSGPAFENGAPRDTVILADDSRLAYRLGKRTVLVGLHTGQQVLAGRGLPGRPPDPGWAEAEAARIRASASPTVWLILMHTRGAETTLFRELNRLGGRVRQRTSVFDIIVAQYVFDRST